MIGISKLYLSTVEPSDALRYGRHSARLPSHLLQFSKDKKPVVVWNCTRACNLRCRHCYAGATGPCGEGELTTAEGKALIDDLAAFGAPVILFSGGEPLARPDLPELAAHAVDNGIRAVISSNGTLIGDAMARRLKDISLSYVGISLDGLRATNDRFRGQAGAFDRALDGIRACREAGLKVGLRYTLTRANVDDLPGIMQLVEDEEIPRVCFYHLAYSGRGGALAEEDLSHAETRRALDRIIGWTAACRERGNQKEVLTVGNHADGPYLYLRMLRENHPGADNVLRLLRMNGGNSTGHGIGCVGWDGTVYPDQFWRNQSLGNIRERPFSEIWTDLSNPLLASLRNRAVHIKGRCRACRFLDVCGGNLRARGEAATGDPWGTDPGCYLTDTEIRRQPAVSRVSSSTAPDTAADAPQHDRQTRNASGEVRAGHSSHSHAGPGPGGQTEGGGPSVVAWEITRRCDLNCRHCRGAAKSHDYAGELKTDECYRVLDGIAAAGRPLIIFTGGEPMARPDVYDIVRYATAEKNLPAVMAPCGHLIDAETAPRLRDAGIAGISISLDSANAENHDAFRGVPGAFDASLRGIRHALDAGIRVQINTTVTKANVSELPGILDFAVDLGAGSFDMFFLVPTGRGSELRDLELSPDQYEDTLRWVCRAAADAPIRVKTTCAPYITRIVEEMDDALGGAGDPAKRPRATGCMAGRGFVFVSHRGELQPCGFFDEPCGNLREADFDFGRVYRESTVFRNLRDLASYKGKCGHCGFVSTCGGCRARALARTGNYLAADPACNYLPKRAT